MSGKSGTIADRSTAVVRKEDADIPGIVERYRKGESLITLAAENGRSRRTIYNWILGELGDVKHREAVTECLVARVADADEELEAARMSRDPVRVSAAREVCRFVRMDLERRRPGLYGPKQEVKHTGAGPMLSIVLLAQPSGEQGGAVLDGTPALDQPGARLLVQGEETHCVSIEQEQQNEVAA